MLNLTDHKLGKNDSMSCLQKTIWIVFVDSFRNSFPIKGGWYYPKMLVIIRLSKKYLCKNDCQNRIQHGFTLGAIKKRMSLDESPL